MGMSSSLKLCYGLLALLCVIGLASATSQKEIVAQQILSADGAPASASVARPGEKRVPLDLFIMSRCPDALRCEAALGPVLDVLGDIVEIEPYYIANIEDIPTICKHGVIECAGDAQQLCVRKYAGTTGFWEFIKCQDSNATAIGEEQWADSCLAKLTPDIIAEPWARHARGCYKSSEGAQLLRNSAHQALVDYKVQTSCTIWVDKKPKCVVDGGIWYNCPEATLTKDLVRAICDAYTGPAPPVCNFSSTRN